MTCKLSRRCTGTICVRSTLNDGCEDLGQDSCLGCGVGRFSSSEPFSGSTLEELLRPGDVYGHFLPEGFTVKQSLHPAITVGSVIQSVDGMPLNPAWLALNFYEQQLPPDEQPKCYTLVVDGQTLILTRN
jgi:hypothetical protein